MLLFPKGINSLRRPTALGSQRSVGCDKTPFFIQRAFTYSSVRCSLNLHCFEQSFELQEDWTAGLKSDGANARDGDIRFHP
jgi:hypothetical protein